VVVTNQVHLLRSFDEIIVLSNGSVEAQAPCVPPPPPPPQQLVLCARVHACCVQGNVRLLCARTHARTHSRTHDDCRRRFSELIERSATFRSLVASALPIDAVAPQRMPELPPAAATGAAGAGAAATAAATAPSAGAQLMSAERRDRGTAGAAVLWRYLLAGGSLPLQCSVPACLCAIVGCTCDVVCCGSATWHVMCCTGVHSTAQRHGAGLAVAVCGTE
jgi:hypothetical protein